MSSSRRRLLEGNSKALVLVLAAGALLAGAPVAGAVAPRFVSYHGYRITIPAAWPVYDLAAHPSACVRFDRHALYLGAPSAVQRCPGHAVGRTEAILIQPRPARVVQATAASARDRAVLRTQPRPDGNVVQLTRGRLLVTATWSRREAVVAAALGVRRLPRAGDGAAAPRAALARGAQARVAGAQAFGTILRGRAVIANVRLATARAPASYTGFGFDACTAPSAAAMNAWLSSPYRAIGIYVGGANAACLGGNLTAGWVSAQAAAGWGFIPTYVGLQAPGACGCQALSLNPTTASSQGAAAAADALLDVQALGLAPGSPIYYDLEAYSRTAANTAVVRAFLSAWTSTLHASGYLSGVYSSAGSGIADLAAAWGSGYLEPDDVWFARWNGVPSTTDPVLAATAWASHQRLHQYAGDHNATYGGTTINIDSDYLDGADPTAGAPALPDGTFVQVAGQDPIFRIAGGAPLYIKDPSLIPGAPIVQVTPQQFATLRRVPVGGTFLRTATGALYRIAGGAPLYVSHPAMFGGAPGAVLIDGWDIDNATNPLAHLAPVPANGTFLTTTSGSVYRIAGGAPFRVTSWPLFGRVQPSVVVDQWNIDHRGAPASHLLGRPVDRTLIRGLPSQWYWTFTGGYRRRTRRGGGAVAVEDRAVRALPSLLGAADPTCVVPNLRRLSFRMLRRPSPARCARSGRSLDRVASRGHIASGSTGRSRLRGRRSPRVIASGSSCAEHRGGTAGGERRPLRPRSPRDRSTHHGVTRLTPCGHVGDARMS